MSAENRAKEIYFSDKYAWSLAEEAISNNTIPSPDDKLSQEGLKTAREKHLISQESRLKALQMFVLGNRIVIPVADNFRFLSHGFLVENGHIIPPMEHLMERLPQNGPEIISEYLAGLGIKSLMEAPINITESALHVTQGRMVLNDIRPVHLNRSTKEGVEKEEVVAIYFRNFIRIPRPITLNDAIKMRKSQNIREWRERIFTLACGITEGTMTENDIRAEIKEGNDIIKGTKDLQAAGSAPISVILTIADVAADYIPVLREMKMAVKIGQLASTGLQAHGWMAEKAVTSGSVNDKYRWLFICD